MPNTDPAEIRPIPPTPEASPVTEPQSAPDRAPDASLEKPPETEPTPAPSLREAERRSNLNGSQPTITPVTTPTAAPTQVVAQKDPERMRIERRLEDGLLEIYLVLEPVVRKQFKETGEAVAEELRSALGTKIMSAHFALKLIIDWLKIIPKVNKFFLEQEAKIKTDKVLEIDREFREKNGL